MFGWLPRYFRRRQSLKYPHRFVEGVDYCEIDHPKYKYEMIRERTIPSSIIGVDVSHKFFNLAPDGVKTVRKGYRWVAHHCDPTVNTPSLMRGSCGHDIDFQILHKMLVPEYTRDRVFRCANEDIRRLCKADGMMWPRYEWVKFGRKYSMPGG